MISRTRAVALGLVLAGVAGSCGTAGPGTASVGEIPAPYAPYAFLIGDWDVGPSDGEAAAVARFHWGPARTYVWYSGVLLFDGEEQPSWEGLLVWNGVRGHLDFLLVLEPASGRLVQEQGTMRVGPDGRVIREITVFYSEGNPLPPDWVTVAGPGGATADFRQTFSADGPDRVLTSVMRREGDGWVPSFPGSDRLLMRRRSSGGGGAR